MKPHATFSTRNDAERHIAARNLAGRQKPQRVGGKWFLVVNRDGTINRSLFTEVMRVELRKLARRESWPARQLARRLSTVPTDSERIWRDARRTLRKVKR
jgi:hypothetical protein